MIKAQFHNLGKTPLDHFAHLRYDSLVMAIFPIKTCIICGEEFELKPDKPGFANRCPSCSEPEESKTEAESKDPIERRNENEVNAERRRVIRDMLYRKES